MGRLKYVNLDTYSRVLGIMILIALFWEDAILQVLVPDWNFLQP